MTDNTRPSDRPLTVHDAVALATIVEASIHNSYVARVADDGRVMHGTARSIGDDRGAFLATGEDVRDAYLRVTLSTGFEAFWPVAELIPQTHSGEFVSPFDRESHEAAERRAAEYDRAKREAAGA